MGHGGPGGTKCAGPWVASASGAMALSESFSSFWKLATGNQKASLASSFPWCHPFRHLEGSLAWGPSLLLSAHQAHKAPPPPTPPWVLLWCLVHQALKGALWVGSFSVFPCVRRLKGQPLYCSAAGVGVWGERGYGDGSTPYT